MARFHRRPGRRPTRRPPDLQVAEPRILDGRQINLLGEYPWGVVYRQGDFVTICVQGQGAKLAEMQINAASEARIRSIIVALNHAYALGFGRLGVTMVVSTPPEPDLKGRKIEP